MARLMGLLIVALWIPSAAWPAPLIYESQTRKAEAWIRSFCCEPNDCRTLADHAAEQSAGFEDVSLIVGVATACSIGTLPPDMRQGAATHVSKLMPGRIVASGQVLGQSTDHIVCSSSFAVSILLTEACRFQAYFSPRIDKSETPDAVSAGVGLFGEGVVIEVQADEVGTPEQRHESGILPAGRYEVYGYGILSDEASASWTLDITFESVAIESIAWSTLRQLYRE